MATLNDENRVKGMELKTQPGVLFAILIVALGIAYWFGRIEAAAFGAGIAVLAAVFALAYLFLRTPGKKEVTA